MKHLGIVRPGSLLRFEFDTFNSTGASVTLTGLAVTDIEIYKDGSTTQRSSDNGYALVDTDGIDIDGVTGIHEFTVDLADNSVAGFYAAGSQYRVVVSSVTVDGSTVSFTAGTFEIGYPSAILNTTIATLSSQTSFTLTAGPAEDDALNGMYCIIHDVASPVQFGRALILDYTGSTKTVTLAAGTTFTAAASDNFSVIDMAPLQPTTTGRTLDVSAGGEAGIDWANIGSPTTTVALSGTSVLLTSGTGTGQLSLNSGAVTVGTNNDKTGYALTQSFPTNFASLAITGGGAVTAGTVSDKTGYSLTQSFPSNFSSLAITAGGIVQADLQTIKTQTVTCSGGVTVPAATLASTSNITTVGAVSGAVGSVTGNVGGSVASVTARVTANTDQWNGVTVTGMPMPTYTQPTGFLAATFPGTVASTTNITAASGVTLAAATHTGAVIPTVTTLTNDPSGVTTLLSRIPSGIFTGMTSLAQWLGLIAGKQTGDTTARTELRATGAGSGTFDETTDSAEAIRDRGDTAWTTATGFSTLDAAGVRSAVGLASANLDTQLTAIDDFLDTEVAAIKAKTDQLTFTVANQVDANALSGAGGLDAAGVRSAIGLASANLDTQLAAIDDYLDTEVAAIKTKTDFLPSATAGTAGGLFIAGTNAPVTITGSGNALTLTSTGGNGHGLAISGNGSGEGLIATGGATGNGIQAVGGATSGSGLYCVATASGAGLAAIAAGNNNGFEGTGAGNGAGLAAYSGANGDGFHIEGTGTGHGMHVVADSGNGFNFEVTSGGDIVGSITGNLSGSVGSLATQAKTDVRDAVGLASANLDTQLTAIDDYLDTEVAAIKAKTDNLPSDPADQSAVEAAITAATSGLATASALTTVGNNVSTAVTQTTASSIRSAVGLATANLDTQLDSLPTNAELATALAGADDATLAAIAALNNLSAAQVNAEVDTALADVGLTTTVTGRIDAAVSTRLATAGYTAPLDAAGTRSAVGLSTANLDTQLGDIPTNAEMVTAITNLLTTQMTEAYAADGTAPTLAQCLFLIQQSLHEFSISGTTRTVKKLDGTTTAATFTLDSSTAPTSTTRAT